MEESKLQKSCQGYHNRRMEHRRVFRNKREDLTSKQMPFKENNPRVQQGGNKVHSVKPIKDEIKPGNVTSRSKPAVANKEQSKTSAKEKDIQVTGMHPKEYKNNEGRKYPSKEKSNRPLKISHPDRTQNKRKKVSIPSVNGEENVAKEQHKIESELMSMKQSDVAIPAVQYLKPAVHVQPLQQHPEGVNSGASGHQGELRHLHNQSNFDLLQNDTSLNLQHLLNERKQDCLVERDHEKESKEVR